MRHHIFLSFCTFLTWFSNQAAEFGRLNCTAEDAFKIAHRFRKSGRYDDGSRCPRETWLEAMASIDDVPTKLFINIGFNKGYNFAVWANVFAPWTGYLLWSFSHVSLPLSPNSDNILKIGIDSMKWFKAIDKTGTYSDWKEACGKCRDCWANFNRSKWSFSEEESHIVMLGLDLNEHNVQLVHDVQKNIIEGNKGAVNFSKLNLTLIHAGASDQNGEIKLKSCSIGDELCSLDLILNETSLSNNEFGRFKHVPLFTVEKLVTDLDKADGLTAGGNIVDILMIDAEGFDPLILKGSKELFRQGRVRCVIFEYHGIGPWLNHLLKDVLFEFENFEMDCYFQGNGRLWPLTGCWDVAYEFHWWSNVMCLKRDDPYHVSIGDFIVRPETQDISHEKKIASVIHRLKELGYHQKDIKVLREKNKLHDIHTAVHFLQYLNVH